MKKILLLFLFSLAISLGESVYVTLGWDKYDESYPDVDMEGIGGFRIHYGKETGVYTYVKEIEGAYETIANLTEEDGLVADEETFSAITCYNIYGLESDFSSEVKFTPKKRPDVPKQFKITSL